MLDDLMRFRDRIEARREVLVPDVRWSGRKAKVPFLDDLLERARDATRGGERTAQAVHMAIPPSTAD